MARRYPAHMKSMKYRYGKVLTGMEEVGATPMFPKTVTGRTETMLPSYAAPLSETAMAGFGASVASGGPLMGMGNGGTPGRGNSSGFNPLPGYNPNYAGPANVFMAHVEGPTKRVHRAPTTGNVGVGDPITPRGIPEGASQKEQQAEKEKGLRPIALVGLIALTAVVVYGFSR